MKGCEYKMESLKNTSRITTLIVAIVLGIITYISAMNPNDLANQLGVYGNMAPVIILICGFIINQYSEESRVKRAEELVHHEYTVLGQPKDNEEETTNTPLGYNTSTLGFKGKTENNNETTETDDTEINTTTDEIPETEVFINTKTEENEDDDGVRQ